MKTARILVVDDEKSAREMLARWLDPARYEVRTAAAVEEAEETMRAFRPDVVVTDLAMPKVDGLQGMERFRRIDPDAPVIIVTAFATIETAVQAMKNGAFDYVRKPFEMSELELVIERAVAHRELVAENRRLRQEVADKFSRDNIICRSRAMTQVMDLIARVATTDISILIQGESGTGKDLFAKYIHHLSNRAQKTFVSLNCSAIPEHLMESELFGHEKGAFSGAVSSRDGFCAEANGGTFFLDEIGDLSLALQPKLLRVLQNGEYYAVGSRRLAHTDVRLVCATNQDLEKLVREGKFRQDLYYRINAVRVVLPPLRDRPQDVPLLVQHFLAQLQKRLGREPPQVGPEAMRCLMEYRWPGNVRELEHVVERASLVCATPMIRPEDLPSELGEHAVAGPALEVASGNYRHVRDEFERSYFTRLLGQTGGSVQKAAQLAGIHRTTLYEKLGKLGIQFDRE
ncbi:MAG: sigma-54-dependent Fis family transcriptional regulator [Deltaproteobacteria bacterium]|nr:sigma-54-dependent Fis family transcriptional regulator [Deltaproteobacteria bacterium]